MSGASHLSTEKKISCETDGHLWSQTGRCVMCRTKRPEWICSECGLPCFADVPHTCYADYQDIKVENARLRAQLDVMLACAYADDGAHECKHCDARWGDSPLETSSADEAARKIRDDFEKWWTDYWINNPRKLPVSLHETAMDAWNAANRGYQHER